MKEILLIFLGGGTGSVLRYLCGQFFVGHGGSTAFPWATFTVNIVGCLLIGLFGSLTVRLGWSDSTRLLLTVGLCGGFTTFSTYCNESLGMLRTGNYLMFGCYVALSIVLGILAVWLGNTVGKNCFVSCGG